MVEESTNIAPKTSMIRYQGVSMRYPVSGGELEVARDISFCIDQGDFVSLVGPSGCGKTTLLNMAAGFIRPTNGSVTLRGKPILAPGRERGVMFQEYGVFPWLSVERNIAFGLNLKASKFKSAAEKKAIVDKYLDLMNLTAFRSAYPKALSGGMRQRLALARTYAAQAECVLMDEPFGALDAQTRSVMHDVLLDLLRVENKTILLITHSVEEAVYLSNKVIVISARPAQIRAVVQIPFAYPRNRALQESDEFRNLKTQIEQMVMQEFAVQEAQTVTSDSR